MKLWKGLLALFFVLVFIDGALRKWVAPGLSTVLYLLKDGVLISAVASYAFSRPVRLEVPLRGTWLPIFLAAYGFWILVEACHPNVPNLAVAVLGVKSHLLYLSLLVLVPAALREMRRPKGLVVGVVLLIVVPVLLLGIYQFFQPTTHWINRYVAASANVVGVNGRPRITGTFSYISGMVTFAKFSISLGFGVFVAGLAGLGRRWAALGAGLFALALVVAPMTGSRSSLVVPGVAFAGVLLLLFWKRQLSGSLTKGLAIIALVVVMLTQVGGLGQGFAGVHQRFEDGVADNRVSSIFTGPFELLGAAGFIGYGVGTRHQAASGLTSRPSSEWKADVYTEGEKDRIIVAVGAIGLILYLLAKFWVTLFSIQALWRARSPAEVGVCTTAFFFLFMHSAAGHLVYSAAAGAMYWAWAGVAVYVWCRQEERRVPAASNRDAKPSAPARNQFALP